MNRLFSNYNSNWHKNALRYAIRMGYRHIDCAMIYQNEHEVGEVFGEMLDKEVPRSEFFIVGKVKRIFQVHLKFECSTHFFQNIFLNFSYGEQITDQNSLKQHAENH